MKPELFQNLSLEIQTPDGSVIALPLKGTEGGKNNRVLKGFASDWSVEIHLTPAPGQKDIMTGECIWTHGSAVSRQGALKLRWTVASKSRPNFLVPAMFYGANRFPSCVRVYPGFDPEQEVLKNGWCNHWSFGADRCAIPAAFCWTDGTMAALAVEPQTDAGMSGVSFSGRANETGIGVDVPFYEEPGPYHCLDLANPRAPLPGKDVSKFTSFGPPLRTYATLKPGQEIKFRFWFQVRQTTDPHGYRDGVRFLYETLRDEHPLNPWMSLNEATDLTAYGLYQWHYQPQHEVLYETILFDREANHCAQGKGDRPHMHVSWVSGVPYAFALMREGVEAKNDEWKEAGRKVIDKISTGISPCGLFWSQWTLENGWTKGWNPNPAWIQARTASEATLFMLRAYEYAQAHGVPTGSWETAIRSNLDFAISHQRDDGNFGSYYDSTSGKVDEWDGAAGILWIPALLAGAKILGKSAYRDSAIKAGHFYRRFVDNALIYGAPEDIHLTPSSEDGYNAVLAYVRLHEDDPQGPWLELAKLAADWMLTFRWIYNIKWPRHTMFEQYDFRTRGADLASPSNNHLHNYGLVCFPELQKLAEWTGDSYYAERNRDHLACFLQFIARADGDFNAYRGMVAERYYNTRYIQAKGMILTLSHTWCVGLCLFACQEARMMKNVEWKLPDQLAGP